MFPKVGAFESGEDIFGRVGISSRVVVASPYLSHFYVQVPICHDDIEYEIHLSFLNR